MSDKRLGVVAVLAAVLVSPACFFIKSEDADRSGMGTGGSAGTGNNGVPAGFGVGAACTAETQCRFGLTCAPTTATCQPKGTSGPGAICTVSAECLPDYFCALGASAQGLPQTACTPRAMNRGGDGATCANEGDCATGFACVLDGLQGSCRMAGAGDIGAACTGPGGCFSGLFCIANVCSTPLALKPWTGAKCDVAEEATARIKFKLPRAADPASDDFFALPFPNDARFKDGKLSMKNFPRPGVGLIPIDPVDRYIKAIEADIDGASPNGTVFFRFSRWPNTTQLGASGVMGVFNVTPGSPAFGTPLGFGWNATTGGAGTNTGSRYICPRYMALRISGRLEAGATYAVIIKGPLADKDNQPFAPDADFAALLAATPPADPELAQAYTRYKPLRDFIADPKSGLAGTPLVGGTVFTVQKSEAAMVALQKAVEAAPVPNLAVKSIVKCGEAISPCDDGVVGADKQRGCLAAPANAAFDEYQGLVTLPVFQAGVRPYETPEQGGAIEYDAVSGLAKVQTTEDVCFSLTVPKGEKPAAGWPVVVYAHGTGGSYLTGRNTWAQDFATGVAAGGAAVPMAMLSYDGALHGTRKGVSTKKVDDLVFNFLNPVSARDTALQGAADLFAMAKVAEAYSQGNVTFDKTKLYLYGHSQGANAAASAAGFDPRYKTVVLSGSGGYLTFSFTTKEKPVNIKAALPAILGDQMEYASADPFKRPENHPLISVLQMYFDRSDPVNLVGRIVAAPIPMVPAKHLLHIYGQKDTYSPEPTQQELGLAAGITLVGPVLTDYPGVPKAAVATKANLNGFTAAQKQFTPAAYDGHFVSSQNAMGKETLLQTLVTAARDGAPTVTP
ncbi:MAG: hypothetical protein SF187_07195 [Deltaproteobacteria bacterium]|nr:hypothetical protein [Deltaproteobacteria bacterium]